MARWYDEFPERFARERDALGELGFELDDAAFEEGRVAFRGSVDFKGSQVELEIVYPDAFPYFRPEVFAPHLAASRHRNPFRGNLCLLERSTRAWEVDNTGAWLISERVPLLLGLLEPGHEEEMREAEAPQGEPASRYYQPALGLIIFVPEAMLELGPEQQAGTFTLSVGDGESIGKQLRGAMTRLFGPATGKGKRSTGPLVAEADEPLQRRFSRTQATGSWVRIESFEDAGPSPQQFWEAARAAPGYVEPQWVRVHGARIKVIGVVASEEVRQGEMENAWMFAVKAELGGQQQITLVRGERLSFTDLAQRIPSLAGMADRTVALTGLGTLGGPIAGELCRSLCGQLRVLDADDVEAGNIVRWNAGLSAIGHAKTTVIAQGLGADYPYTNIAALGMHLGGVSSLSEGEAGRRLEGRTESELIEEFLDGADLLIDATAELGVQHFLSSQALARSLPQIYVSMTEGGLGGMIARVVPGRSGCWYCLQRHLYDQTILAPPFAETGSVQPRGCAAPTFTGSSFDALPVIAQTMRVATSTLLDDDNATDRQDVFVLSMSDGSPGVPTWATYRLAVHPECQWCSAETALR